MDVATLPCSLLERKNEWFMDPSCSLVAGGGGGSSDRPAVSGSFQLPEWEPVVSPRPGSDWWFSLPKAIVALPGFSVASGCFWEGGGEPCRQQVFSAEGHFGLWGRGWWHKGAVKTSPWLHPDIPLASQMGPTS